jgi:hypothetical protein
MHFLDMTIQTMVSACIVTILVNETRIDIRPTRNVNNYCTGVAILVNGQISRI